MLLSSDPMTFASNLSQSNIELPETPSEKETFEKLMKSTTRGIKMITLTEEDRQRIYEPWKCSIIVKLCGKRILHQYLKRNSRAMAPNGGFLINRPKGTLLHNQIQKKRKYEKSPSSRPVVHQRPLPFYCNRSQTL